MLRIIGLAALFGITQAHAAGPCFSDLHTVDALPSTFDSSAVAGIYAGAGMSAPDQAYAKRVIPYLEQKTDYHFKLTRWSDVEDSTLADHLFKADNLKILWITFDILPKRYSHLKSLDFIAREPDYNLVDEGAAEYVSYSSGRPGNIVYGFNLFEGASAPARFYDIMAIHELTHALDEQVYQETRRYLSDDPSWLAYFAQNTFLPTENAMLSPSEDLADSAAYYMVFPDLLKSIAPLKFEFLKQQIFEGKAYDTDTLKAQYASEVARRLPNETAAQIEDRIRAREYRGCEVLGR